MGSIFCLSKHVVQGFFCIYYFTINNQVFLLIMFFEGSFTIINFLHECPIIKMLMGTP